MEHRTKTQRVTELAESMKRASIVKFSSLSGHMPAIQQWAEMADSGIRTASHRGASEKAAEAIALIAMEYQGGSSHDSVSAKISFLAKAIKADTPTRTQTVLRKLKDRTDAIEAASPTQGFLSRYRGKLPFLVG